MAAAGGHDGYLGRMSADSHERGAESVDRASSVSGAEDEMDEHDKIMTGYSLRKWAMGNDLKNRIYALKRKVVAEEAEMKGDDGAAASLWRQNSSAVEEYWDDKKAGRFANPKVRLAVMILEEVFGTWLELKRMRNDRKFAGHSTESKVQVIQNAIRRMLAVLRIKELSEKRKREHGTFAQFCEMMSKGVLMRMFSRKYGTVMVREIGLASDCKSFEYFTGKYNPVRRVEVKEIYKVVKGMSGQVYPQARIKHKHNTFHIDLLGGKTLDFETTSQHDFQIVFNGFQYLHKVACSRTSPFYIDKDGVPSRAVGSIIRSALPRQPENPLGYTEKEAKRKKHAKSDADLMRFRLATTQGLKAEYERWAREGEEELRAFKKAQAEALELERQLASQEAATQVAKKKSKKGEEDTDSDSDSDDEKVARDAAQRHILGEDVGAQEVFENHMSVKNSRGQGQGQGQGQDQDRHWRGEETKDGYDSASTSSSKLYSFASSDDNSDGAEDPQHHRALRAHKRIIFTPRKDFPAQLEDIYYKYAPEKVDMIPMLAEHFHGRESVLLFELYKKYRVDISHAHLFGAAKEKKGGTWADEDSDDTREHGDPESGSESDGNGGRVRVPPPAKQGSRRWKYEKFQEMYGHGLRHDDHHELDSESLHPSQDSVLGPILKKRYGGARATAAAAAAGGGDGSSSSSSGWDEEQGEGEGLSYDERAIIRSQNAMKEKFEAMYGSGEGEEGSEHESESEEEEDEESLYEEDLHDLSDLRSAEPLVVGGTHDEGDDHRHRHHRQEEEEEEGSEYESESEYESDSASSGDDPDESTR